MIGQQIGSYEILEEIGRGGMATVYRAFQRNVERSVAIKVIDRNIARDEISLERFRREARLVARLEHHHILPLYDFDGLHDPPYIVMRLLEGGTLRDIMRRRQFKLSEVATLMYQISSALDYAHRQGIVHRDIKPSNIMFDQDGNAFVTDFGIAFTLAERRYGEATHLTQTGLVIGTPDYMSPEQGVGDPFDHRADIYAIGVMLFQLLTGKMPYSADSAVALIIKHRDEPIPLPTDYNPYLPPILNDIIERAMAKDPNQRYGNIMKLAADFVDAVGGDKRNLGIKEWVEEGSTSKENIARADRADKLMSPDSDPFFIPPEQNKIVTAMYVIASEYEEIIEAMEGRETAFIVMNVLIETFINIIKDYGGVVFSHDENTILALWGSEFAREDDPEQAIRAALALRKTLQDMGTEVLASEGEDEPLPLNIGVHTGPALLSLNEYAATTATGATINLTTRLAQRAEGAIFVTQSTYRYVQDGFDFEQVDKEIKSRGRQARKQLAVYAVSGTKERPFHRNVFGVEGVQTRMIGRDSVIKELENAYLLAAEDNETQIVTVIGEMGMGKSRLLHEFVTWFGDRDDKARLFVGRGMREADRPYSVMRDMISKRFELYDSDTAEVIRRKLERNIAQLYGLDNLEMAHLIGHLLHYNLSDSVHIKGLLGDPQQFTQRARQQLLRFFSTIAEDYPTLMMIEDMHWADDASLDVIQELVTNFPKAKLMVIGVARPQFYERRPHWGSGLDFHQRVELTPLAKRDSRDLVREILKRMEEVPDNLRDMIVDRAEGNPYFMEELIKMMIEDRVIQKVPLLDETTGKEKWYVEAERLESLPVPPTLAGLLQARLDNLLYPEKVVLNRASVIGKVFWEEAVIALAEADEVRDIDVSLTLSMLAKNGFIHPRENSTFKNTREYVFSSNILLDTVYENLLRSQQRTYHGRFADWLIDEAHARTNEYNNLIASHYERADQGEKAVEFLMKAGRQAVQVSAFDEAFTTFHRALRFLPADDDEQRIRLLIRMGEGLLYKGDLARSSNVLQLALDLARQNGHSYGTANSLFFLAQIVTERGDLQQARAYLDEAMAVARNSQFWGTLARILYGLGDAAWRAGDMQAAEDYLNESLTIAKGEEDQVQTLYTLTRLGTVMLGQGERAKARDTFEKCLLMASEYGNRERAIAALQNLEMVAEVEGDFNRASDLVQTALSLARDIGNDQSTAALLMKQAHAFIRENKLEAARQSLHEGLQIAVTQEATPLILAALIAHAHLSFKHSARDQALMLLGLVKGHPAIQSDIAQMIDPIVTEAKVGADELIGAMESARGLDLATVVQELLDGAAA